MPSTPTGKMSAGAMLSPPARSRQAQAQQVPTSPSLGPGKENFSDSRASGKDVVEVGPPTDNIYDHYQIRVRAAQLDHPCNRIDDPALERRRGARDSSGTNCCAYREQCVIERLRIKRGRPRT